MGLFDLLTGRPDRMLRGGGGMFGGGGGMSPITMGVLGLLAYKAVQGLNKPAGSGGIGDWLRKTFGADGASASGNAGGILSGGLRDLMGQFQQSGQGDVAKSWVDTGANKQITPDVLARVLSEEQIATLMAHTGLSREALLQGMSEELPRAVDTLTPEGRVPDADEMHRVIDRKAA